VFLDGEIREPDNYRELLAILFNATAADTIRIYINSGGGDGDSAFAIIEAIKNTQANVTAVLVGSCHSAASMISMYCHAVVVLDSATSMVHTATFGSFGNTSNVQACTDFTVRRFEKLLNQTYAGFLSDDELSKVKSGVELWFDADEIRTRMKNRAAVINSQKEKDQPEI
jgi:ATP-dependent protease ClpP protease subunit